MCESDVHESLWVGWSDEAGWYSVGGLMRFCSLRGVMWHQQRREVEKTTINQSTNRSLLFRPVTLPFLVRFVLHHATKVNYGSLDAAIRYVISKKQLQPVPWFIEKVIQLYEMIVVRHGLMVVGPAGGGKTANIYTLQEALTMLSKAGIRGERYEKVLVKYVRNTREHPSSSP
jgi:hypothetical protein